MDSRRSQWVALFRPMLFMNLSERIIGKTCRDFDGLQTIWQFFEHCSR